MSRRTLFAFVYKRRETFAQPKSRLSLEIAWQSTRGRRGRGRQLGRTSIFGLATGAETDDGHIALTLFVRNLFDRRIPSYIEPALATGVVGDGVGPALLGTGSSTWLGLGESRLGTSRSAIWPPQSF